MRREPGFKENVESTLIMARYKSMLVSNAARGGIQKSAAKILYESTD